MANATTHLEAGLDTALAKRLTAITDALCHAQELIALAYQLSCELHPRVGSEAVLCTSGRLATLMHVAAQQINGAQAETSALSQSAKALAVRVPLSNRRDH